MASHTAAERAEQRRQAIEQIKDRLTHTQYRRLCLHYIEELSVEEIADIEGVFFRPYISRLKRQSE